MKQVWALAMQEWKRMLWASFWAFLTVASSVGLMMSSGYILTYAALQPSIAVLSVAIVGVRFFGIARGAFRWLDRMLSHETALHLLEHYRVWFYHRLEPLVPTSLRHIAKGELFQALARDVDSLEFLYVRVIAPPLVALWTTMLMAFLLGRHGWIYWVIFAVAQVVAIVISLSLLPRMAQSAQRARQRAGELHSTWMDVLQARQELRVRGTLSAWEHELVRLESDFNSQTRRAGWLTAVGESILPLVGMLGVLGVAWVGGEAVLSQNLGGVLWVTLVLGAWAAFESVLAFPQLAQALQASQAAADRLQGIATLPVVRTSLENASQLAPEESSSLYTASKSHSLLSIKDISYQWPDGAWVFQQFDLEIKAGENVALLGPSGAGKSTIVQILARFLDPSSGKVFLQGQSILQMTDSQVREKIAILDQAPQLFTGTLADNLQLAAPQASTDEMREALEQAGLWTWAMDQSPENPLNSWVGEQGVQLSGGQRQRLATAQVLLRPSLLIVLDELAAHLDPEAEEALLEVFFAHLRNNPQKALLVITHRQQFLNRFSRSSILGK